MYFDSKCFYSESANKPQKLHPLKANTLLIFTTKVIKITSKTIYIDQNDKSQNPLDI